jgi:hypothetical protein
VSGPPEVETAARARTDYICSEVLAREFALGGAEPVSPDAMQSAELDGSTVRIAITRVA